MASLSGNTIIQNRDAPPIIVIDARAIVGPMVMKLGDGWNILAGGACRGAQTTLIIKRILYADVNPVANKKIIINR